MLDKVIDKLFDSLIVNGEYFVDSLIEIVSLDFLKSDSRFCYRIFRYVICSITLSISSVVDGLTRQRVTLLDLID